MKQMMCAVAVTALVAVGWPMSASAADTLYDFETGAQGWFSFGGITTDSGNEVPGSDGTTVGRFHTGDFSLGGFGMGDASPTGIDLTPYIGLSIDMFWDVPDNLTGGQVPFSGTPETELMLAIGYAEWSTTVPLTGGYETYSVDFVDLTPNYYASIAPYFGALPSLDDPGLKIQLITRNSIGTGVGTLHYDQILGIVPEPAAGLLVVLGGVALTRRHRRRSA
jgi:hypothetical protein